MLNLRDGRTISLNDAREFYGPLSFNLMVKPAGSSCNLDCMYCYYAGKSKLTEGVDGIMSMEVLETLVKEYAAADDMGELTFNWHGGEPLLAGLDFYREALGFQKRYASGKKVYNTIQTNGTLINDEWADFLAENDFLVGISIDGPEDIHDRYRLDRGLRPSFERTMAGLQCLKKAGAQFNTMSVISKASEGRGLETYSFLKSVGSRYMQFMPAVERISFSGAGKRPGIAPPYDPDAVPAPWSVSSLGFGRFMCDIFDWWVKNDVGKYYVGLFDATLAGWCGVLPGTCIYGETCGKNPVIERNGDIYPCDHFVYDETLMGNIMSSSLRSIVSSPSQAFFGMEKRDELPEGCLSCRYLQLCNGECPKHRFVADGENGRINMLCDGYRMFFSHTEPYMLKMRELLEADLPPAMIMSTQEL